MSLRTFYKNILSVALIGLSATCFISCDNKKAVEAPDPETLITMQSTNHVLINSANGKISYHAETPLMERYEQASEPYMEFRKGIHVTTFNDSTGMASSDIVADYAKYIEPQELWEARGNVVVTTDDGKVLETEQLFWDQRIDKIYSNVDSKMTDGDDVVVGIAFESDSAMENYRIIEPRGQVTVDAEPRSETTPDSDAEVSVLPGETEQVPAVTPIRETTTEEAPAVKPQELLPAETEAVTAVVSELEPELDAGSEETENYQSGVSPNNEIIPGFYRVQNIIEW